MKKTPRHIIILHTYNINDNHMMYGSWDMKHDGQNFSSFWTVFLPFYPPNNPKNQNLKNWKKRPRDIILHMCAINDNQMMYGCWHIEHDRQFFCHFGPFFALLLPNGSWDIECDGQSFLSFGTIFCPFTP